ncbi:MAG: amidohydrolase [Candidatus Bathyarchaeia archaeon]|jgi:5-methylthioadenosine/S-adenosylhomocysteine deaminase
MNVIIEGATIVTMDDSRRVVNDGTLVIEQDRIAKICKHHELQKTQYHGYEILDARGKAIFPGFINAHTHVAMQLFRGICEDQPNSLYDYIFPMERYLTGEDCYIGSLLGCVEALKSGVTCISDHYHFMEHTAKAVEETGIRGVLAHKIWEIDLSDPPRYDLKAKRGVYNYVREEAEKRLAEGVKLVREWHNAASGRITCRLGPHAPDTCSTEILQRIRELASKHNVGIFIHCSQSEMEVQQIQRRSRKSGSVDYLDNIGFLGPDVLAAHCIFVNQKEIRVLRNTGTKVSHNPVSNAEDGVVAPIVDMLGLGVTVGLGTDCFSMDILSEMRHAALLNKVKHGNPLVISARKVLEMATRGSAQCLGLEKEIGSLQEGKKADIVIVDLRKPHLVPMKSVETNLVYYALPSDIDTVIINGEIVVKDGRVTTIDENMILEKARKTARDWWKRSGKVPDSDQHMI